MSKRTSSMATNGDAKKSEPASCTSPSFLPCPFFFALICRHANHHTAYDKQKDLLSSETGHFSLIRAMHLADLITELNG